MTFLHIGDHTSLRLYELAEHVFEADHIIFIALTALVGVAAYRQGRRVEARVRAKENREP
jgi:hypothetical protein